MMLVVGSWTGTAATFSETVEAIGTAALPWMKGLMVLASFVLTIYAIYDYHLKVSWKRRSERRDKLPCSSIGECANLKIAKKLEGYNEKSA